MLTDRHTDVKALLYHCCACVYRVSIKHSWLVVHSYIILQNPHKVLHTVNMVSTLLLHILTDIPEGIH